jgi:hypothetical protein
VAGATSERGKVRNEGVEMLNVHWVKSVNDTWLPLIGVNLADVDADGVYIIWHEGNPGRVVRVGQGYVKTRLTAHRQDNEIMAYAKKGILRVTWASVSEAQMDGVERFLADQWVPLVGDVFPDVLPIEVNSPW